MMNKIQAVYVCQPTGEWIKFMGESTLVPSSFPSSLCEDYTLRGEFVASFKTSWRVWHRARILIHWSAGRWTQDIAHALVPDTLERVGTEEGDDRFSGVWIVLAPTVVQMPEITWGDLRSAAHARDRMVVDALAHALDMTHGGEAARTYVREVFRAQPRT